MTIRKYIVNLLLLAFSIHLGAENVRVIENFDYNWLFGRYGLQADGSKIEEPAAVQDVSFNDSCWKQLDLPHDWAVEGPFRTDLEGFTGKLPWRGIGWYRKHFKVDKTVGELNPLEKKYNHKDVHLLSYRSTKLRHEPLLHQNPNRTFSLCQSCLP